MLFSDVSFLKVLQRDRMRKVKIRQIVLLLLRTLIVACAVLAFARPTFRGTLSGTIGAYTRTSAAVLLDQSYSMGYRTDEGRLIDLGKRRTYEILDLMNPQDEIFLIPFSDTPGSPADNRGNGLAPLKRLIEGMEVRNRGTDVGRALEKADQLLKGAEGLNKELYLITDLTENGWSHVLGLAPVETDLSAVYVLPVGPLQGDNVSVDTTRVSTQLIAAGRPMTVEATVTNRGSEHLSDLVLNLYMDDRRTRQTAVDLGPKETQRVHFNVVPEMSGRVSGYVETGEDRLLIDNRSYFTIEVPSEVKVLLVGGSLEDLYFAKRVLGEGGFARVSETLWSALSEDKFEKADVVLLNNVPRLPHPLLTALEEWVRLGGGLILSLGEEVDLWFYNERLLSPFFSVKLKAPLGTPGDKRAYFSLGEIQFDHPVFNGLVRENRLESPQFYAVFDVAAPPDVRVLARYGNGTPALCEGTKGKGRVVLITTAFDLDWTDMPIRGVFAPLLHRLVQYLAVEFPSAFSYVVGHEVRRSAFERRIGTSVLSESPVGDRTAIWPEQLGREYFYRIGPVEYPGVWRLLQEEQEIDRFSVNINTKESDQRRVEVTRLEEIFGSHRLQIVPSEEAVEAVVLKSRYGRELWKEFLGAAFLLMIVETALSKASGGSNQNKSQTLSA